MDHDIDMLFLGGLFPKKSEPWILENTKGVAQHAANVLQWNLVDGFRAHLGKSVRVYSALFIGSFPKRFRRPWVRSRRFGPEFGDILVGFLNLPVIKHVSQARRLRRPIKQWVVARDNPSKIAVAYSFTYSMIASLKFVKKCNESITTCLVVPDLPEYMNVSGATVPVQPTVKSIAAEKIYRYLKRRLYAYLRYVDSFVLLTEQMTDHIGSSKPIVVCEGISAHHLHTSGDTGVDTVGDQLPCTIVYAGSLHVSYGVMRLVEAFGQLPDPSARLVLCGSGDAELLIRDSAVIDPRIELRGQVSRDEVLDLESLATVLVNPRTNVGEYTKYSFPSKLIEYLSSGTPVVAHELSGVPAEYSQYVHYAEDESVESLARKLAEVCSMTPEERRREGESASRWVHEEKNPYAQTGRILHMLESVSKGQSAHAELPL
ncbi:MAG TPA: glycosyltransferase family 4 protein [Actinomycetaceae bacterium]|nr:glycosyltransferase family 4 protein [Actinomycetaceae bacterium]